MAWKLIAFFAATAAVIGCFGQPPRGMPPIDYQTAALFEHNNYRQRHGTPPLQMDPHLNEAATKCAEYYAKKHIMDHSCLTGVEGHGENIYAEWGTPNPDINQVVRNAIRYWYDENQIYNYNDPGATPGSFGHFTQSVWQGSRFMGLGVARDGDYVTVVAKYSPHGNILGDNFQLYKENVPPPVGPA